MNPIPIRKARLRNALLCSAYGDAVGFIHEFENPTPTAVLSTLKKHSPLEISDDTQMTLYGMAGLMDATVPTPRGFIAGVEHAYLSWYAGQAKLTDTDIGFNCSIHKEKALHKIKAPGHTCLTSLERISMGQPVMNNSKGCGTVMRLLPFVFMDKHLPHYEDRLAVAQKTSLMTHRHVEITEMTTLLMGIYEYLYRSNGAYKLDLPREVLDAQFITDLGEGWTAKECVYMALWAFANAHDFQDLMVKAITHRGDSDSVACIAGALWGLAGKDAPLGTISTRLVEYPVINKICNKFTAFAFGEKHETV